MFVLRPAFFGTGAVLALLALAMGLPAVVDFAHGDPDWRIFAASACVTLFTGLALMASNHGTRSQGYSVRQIFLLTALSWMAVCVAAALPFAFSGLHFSAVDALFEAVSGVTTTGATVLRNIDRAPPGILLWRGLLQWLGGMGFLVIALAVLPTLNIGGMQIFRLDSGDPADRPVPRAATVSMSIMGLYAGLTGLLTLLLWTAGMSRFPALLHAMSTISSGGFSTSDGSIGSWRNPAIDWVILFGMLLGGAPFIVYLQIAEQRWQTARKNRQLRLYLRLFLTASLILALWLIIEQNAKPLVAIRHAAFTAASVMTGSGFATLDWAQWSGVPMAVLFFLTFVGGCAGSTSGGIKIFRFQILYANARIQMSRLLHPHGVTLPQYDKRPIPDAVAESVLGFLFIYALSFVVVAMGLGMVGMDFWTSMSASASALANLGPGLTPAVGPMNGFSGLPDAAKLLLSAAMLFGRLEMFIFLALFAKGFWRA
ncbi:TrkH family potassium uptake protein [Telmatospirillum siberiense]|uniref:Trk system potassium uptake protein n=1 Tax=Telmatospirillum siberiense TaxID=382514 RepID=A0A2N3Q0F2_9PROT|nr:TrkH family potassium uptake protein [Telmatospirillum siberiense]PKU26123.1 potassium transporter TrkH [Telmatospirillum siberiense]